MMCDKDLFRKIDYFKVHDLVPYSIHCMISCLLKTSWCTYNNSKNDVDNMLHELPSQYKWSNNSVSLWQKALLQPTVIKSANMFLNDSSNVDIMSIT